MIFLGSEVFFFLVYTLRHRLSKLLHGGLTSSVWLHHCQMSKCVSNSCWANTPNLLRKAPSPTLLQSMHAPAGCQSLPGSSVEFPGILAVLGGHALQHFSTCTKQNTHSYASQQTLLPLPQIVFMRKYTFRASAEPASRMTLSLAHPSRSRACQAVEGCGVRQAERDLGSPVAMHPHSGEPYKLLSWNFF